MAKTTMNKGFWVKKEKNKGKTKCPECIILYSLSIIKKAKKP